MLKVAISISLLVYLVRKVDLSGVHNRVAEVSVWHIVTAGLILMMQAVGGALRWSLVIETISARVRLRAALHIMFIGLFFNQTLPSSIGGDAMRIWHIRHHGFPLRTAINSVLLDRLIALAALAVFMLISFPVLYQLVGDAVVRGGVLAVSVALIGGFMVLYFFRLLPKWFHRWRIVEEVRHLSREAHTVAKAPRSAGRILLLSMVMHAMTGTAIYEIARGLGVGIGLVECVVLVPPISLLTILPISVAGWGVREAAMISGLAYVGIDANDALVTSIIFGLLLMMISVPGGVFWFLKHKK